MDVREFVKQSLLDIIGGVVDAQNEIKSLAPDAKISPAYAKHEPDAGVVANRRQSVSLIEFDIAVTVAHAGKAEAGGSAKGGVLSVFSGTVEGAVEYAQERSNVSRLRFDVPIAFPRHDPTDGRKDEGKEVVPMLYVQPRRGSWIHGG